MKRFLFIGERPSATAIAKRWTWRDGRLAAKQLFDGLRACGIDPQVQVFENLFQLRRDAVRPGILNRLRSAEGCTIVAMGQLVSRRLTAAGIAHVTIVHPAARGRIRGKYVYAAHLKERLNIEE